VAVETAGSGWPERAEAVIRNLESVDAVTVIPEGDEIREIHVETSSSKKAKQIVRDVQTILRTRLNRGINYRIVSVAYVRKQPMAPRPQVVHTEPRQVEAPPTVRPVAPALPEEDAESLADRSGDRIRFESVNLFVSGPRVQAQVELRWRGLARTGSAAGLGSREDAYELVANATVAAVQEFLEDGVALGGASVERLKLARHDVMVVAVPLLAHRTEKLLVGSCTVERDAQQAVALATLASLNRVAGGLRVREPVEYVLRPASAQEASEAEHE